MLPSGREKSKEDTVLKKKRVIKSRVTKQPAHFLNAFLRDNNNRKGLEIISFIKFVPTFF